MEICLLIDKSWGISSMLDNNYVYIISKITISYFSNDISIISVIYNIIYIFNMDFILCVALH